MVKLAMIASILTITLLTTSLVGCQRSPETNPGEPLLLRYRLVYDHTLTLKAGETKSATIPLETRKDGPGEVTYSIYQVTNQYSEEKLPAIEDLDTKIEQSTFMAYPEATYYSTIVIKTNPQLAVGDYYLMLEYHFENVAEGRGWIRVNVESD